MLLNHLPWAGVLLLEHEFGVLLGIDNVWVVQSQLLGPEKDVVGCLDTQHHAVVLVSNLVLIAAKPAPAPDVVLLQPRECLAEDLVAAQGRGGVPVLDAAVVKGHDLVARLQELRVDGSQQSLLHNCGPTSGHVDPLEGRAPTSDHTNENIGNSEL